MTRRRILETLVGLVPSSLLAKFVTLDPPHEIPDFISVVHPIRETTVVDGFFQFKTALSFGINAGTKVMLTRNGEQMEGFIKKVTVQKDFTTLVEGVFVRPDHNLIIRDQRYGQRSISGRPKPSA